jgi:hypothetical protein
MLPLMNLVKTCSPVNQPSHTSIPVAELRILPASYRANTVTYPVQLVCPAGTTWDLWFSAPKEQQPLMGNILNASVIGVLQPLMCLNHQLGGGLTLHCHGAVSPSLAWQLNQFQAMWANWGPYRPVTFSASEWREPALAHPEAGAILAFSGGADSCFTAWELTRTNHMIKPVVNLDHGLFVHGFDIALTDQPGFTQALASANQQAVSIGLPLVTVTTNLRQLHDHYLNWEQSHASAIAATLALFQPSHTAALLSNTYPYSDLVFPWGSNPITDPLLSHAHFPLIPYGAAVDRLTKLNTLQAWPEGLTHIRVCWQPQAKGGNCGVCAKCIRYRVMFSVLGNNRPACFPVGIPPLSVVLPTMRLTQAMLKDFEHYYQMALPMSPDWLPAMKRLLRFSRFKARITSWRPFRR